MKRNSLLLQALAVTVMGFVAHITAPAPASSTTMSLPCGYSYCTGVCGIANPCDEECGWICLPPGNDKCEMSTLWYQACPIPT